ncbi:MAG TPA: hypothetical protein VLW85_08160 [Myxococcales bacterium]|nr:hypothetical protein [Myxococcales bacterium]
MSDEQKVNEAEELKQQQTENPKNEKVEESEFKVTVRKLEMPVRPRGVLADG